MADMGRNQKEEGKSASERQRGQSSRLLEAGRRRRRDHRSGHRTGRPGGGLWRRGDPPTRDGHHGRGRAEGGREIKIGFVTPLTGRYRLVRRARPVLRRPGHRSHRRRHRLRRRQEAPDHDHHHGQPVRHQPGCAGDGRPDQQRQGRPDRHGLDPRHGVPGGRPG